MKANGKLGGTVINYINTNLSFICLFRVMTETIIDNDNSLLHWFIKGDPGLNGGNGVPGPPGPVGVPEMVSPI